MSSGIFSIRDGSLTELNLAPFDAEDVFQELLSKHPSLIAGDQINSNQPRRWLLVCREMGIPGEENGSDRWSVDHLFLDQDGIPTLVEVKRSTDTRLRREVVGQMLDYAANAVLHWPVATIQSEFQLQCEREGRDADEELAEFLGDETEPDSFWASVETNLQARKVRMLFVADRVPNELRRVVEFLNEQMNPAEVLALEIKRYAGGGQETLVPRIYGQTAEAERKKGRGRLPPKKWDEASFFAAIDEEGDVQLKEKVRAVYGWARSGGSWVSWGRGAKYGSFQISASDESPKVIFVYTTGSLEFSPTTLSDLPPFSNPAVMEELARRLNGVSSITISPSSWDKTWVVLKLQDLGGDADLEQLLSVLDWLLKQLRESLGADVVTL